MNSDHADPIGAARRAPPACLLAAQDYLKRGWSPIALCPADHAAVDAAHQRTCTTPGSAPLWPWTDYQQRLPSERVLSIYWNRNSHSNVGLALGPVSGLVALIVDGTSCDALPETLEVIVPDGRRLLLYALPEKVALPSAVRLPGTREEIPCLSAASFVVMPPSRHVNGGQYVWRAGCSPEERTAAPAPPWLIENSPTQEKVTETPPNDLDTRPEPCTAVEAERPASASADRLNPRPSKTQGMAHVVLLDQIESTPTHWLWPGRIPLGKLTVLDGDPGLGKSTLLLDLAARITRGAALPDGAAGVSGGVILLTAEDSLADTVRPRLEAAGADLERIRAFSAVGELDGGNRPPVIPRDLELLRDVLTENDSRLLVIDPFLAYLGGGVDSCNDQDIRRCLHRLAELAEATHCAVVLLRHLNKLSGGKALYRGAGSIGIIGAARSGLLVARDPDSETHRVLACTKSNLTVRPASLRFTLELARPGVCRLAWHGASPYEADELINQPEPVEEQVLMHDAAHFLRTLLADGAVAADECLRQARAISISEKTLRRAKSRLKIQSIREGDGLMGHWLWELPRR